MGALREHTRFPYLGRAALSISLEKILKHSKPQDVFDLQAIDGLLILRPATIHNILTSDGIVPGWIATRSVSEFMNASRVEIRLWCDRIEFMIG